MRRALLASLLALSGCTFTTPEDAVCTPGRSVLCACPDGRDGAQVCGRDQRFGACACAEADAGLGVPDAGEPDASRPDAGARPVPTCDRVLGSPRAVAELGVVLPLTGPLQAVGEGMLQGVEVALDAEAEAGRPARALVCDSAGDPVRAAAAIGLIAARGLRAVVGPATSAALIGALDASDTAGVVLLSPSATAPWLVDTPQVGQSAWSLALSDAEPARALGVHARETGVERPLVIAGGRAWETRLAEAFAEGFCPAPCARAGAARVTSEDPRLDAVLAEGAYDLAVLFEQPEPGFNLLGVLLTGPAPVWIGEPLATEAAFDRVGEAAGLDAVLSASAAEGGPAIATFAAAHELRFGAQPGRYAAHAFDATRLMARAAAGGRDAAGIIAWLQALGGLSGASSTARFDEGVGRAPVRALGFDVDAGAVVSRGLLLDAEGRYVSE